MGSGQGGGTPCSAKREPVGTDGFPGGLAVGLDTSPTCQEFIEIHQLIGEHGPGARMMELGRIGFGFADC